MAPTLYSAVLRPPTRAVMLTAHALDIDLNYKPVDIQAGENLTPAYTKMNPQHTVPTLVEEDGSAIWDSHVISAYLASKYAKNDLLYPKDLKQRALVDQRLHFDGAVIFPKMCAIFRPLLFGTECSISEEKKIKIEEAYQFLNSFLNGRNWLAGDHVTIADLCIIASISSLDIIIPVKADKFPRLREWIERCETLPYYQKANGAGLTELKALVKQNLK